MTLYKVQFSKHRKGQTYFERSVPWSSVTLMLILCDEVKVVYKKNKNKITFIFHKAEANTYCTVLNVRDYLAKTIISMEEWQQL